MHKKTMAVAVLALGVLAPVLSPANANILVNGDFETNTQNWHWNGVNPAYLKLNAGSTVLTGWTVELNSVDLIQGWTGSINGIGVDLAGSPGPGAISQSFAAVAGYTYTLNWDYGFNGGSDLIAQVGTTTGNFTAISNSVQHGVLQFVAQSTDTYVVRFATPSTNTTNGGPTLDNVVLTAVPEPESAAMLLAGLGVIGFLARRRRVS